MKLPDAEVWPCGITNDYLPSWSASDHSFALLQVVQLIVSQGSPEMGTSHCFFVIEFMFLVKKHWFRTNSMLRLTAQC